MSKGKPKRDYVLFIEDILSSINKIEKYSNGMSFEEFCGNGMAIDAIVRNFEIIGEAVKNIPEEVKEKYSNVEWKLAAGFRDVLIHNYFSVNKEAVWDTIHNNIPSFKNGIARVLEMEKA